MEWQQDQFLTPDKSLIQCATHGALFEITTGLCIAGPCQKQVLLAVDIDIRDGWVFPKL